MPLDHGLVINNRFQIVRLLGQGGFGAVYQAHELVLDVERAIKVLHPGLAADPEFIERFRREARIAARLEHAHIVPVYELSDTQGTYYLVMKYLPGGSLKELLAREKRLPYLRALEITRQVASALDFAYQSPERLIHRDIKPGNILFEADGSARLADFGFAKALEGGGSASLSRSGGLIGTPAYLAPEIWSNQPASPLSDQYSLACVFFEMITGEPLTGDESPIPVIIKRHLDPLVLPERWPAGVPAGVVDVLRQALSRDPAGRYPSAGAFAKALEETLKLSETFWVSEAPLTPDPSPTRGMGSARPLSPVPSPTRKWKWFGLGAELLAGLAVLAGLVVGVVLLIQSAQDDARWRAAQTEQAAQTYATQTAQAVAPGIWDGTTQISPVDGMVLRYIPGGTFQMGSESGESDEQPVHSVTLDGFWMDQTEVTNAMYRQCMADGACSAPNDTSSYTHDSYYGNSAYADYPVINVDWNQAEAYCTWAGRELPTEAEWEVAARGGLAGATYPWGNEFDGSLVNYCDANCPFDNWKDSTFNDGYADTAPVGSYAANGYGLYDMAGNVWEWVADWYGPYSSATAENPTGPASGDTRALRGGSWFNYGYGLRVSDRRWDDPDYTIIDVGFRCVRSP